MDFSAVQVVVMADGYVVAPTVQRLTTHCPVSLQQFPKDSQTCEVQMSVNMPEDCIKLEETSHTTYIARYRWYNFLALEEEIPFQISKFQKWVYRIQMLHV